MRQIVIKQNKNKYSKNLFGIVVKIYYLQNYFF